MTTTFDFTKLRRLITIYAVVQVVLVALLIYVALLFQAGLQADPVAHRFLKSVVATLILQLALFYPINKFAAQQAAREVDASAIGITPEELKALRTKRMVGDVIKMSVFVFFVTFIYKMPPNKFVLSIFFFTFILTILCYFQCFNFAARRLMREKG